jgi:hypothetical protein
MKYQKNSRIQLTRKLYFDGSIGANGRFNFSGDIMGVRVGYTMVKVMKKILIEKTGQAVFDGQWKANSELTFDGKYTYYQTGTETFLLGG